MTTDQHIKSLIQAVEGLQKELECQRMLIESLVESNNEGADVLAEHRNRIIALEDQNKNKKEHLHVVKD